MRGWWVVATAAALAGLAGCYDQPKPSCSFSCATSQLCPDDYQCAPDGLCHLVLSGGGLAECPELLPDASTTDAPIDAQFDAVPPDAGPPDATLDATVDAQVVDAQVFDAHVIADAAPDATVIDAAPDATVVDAAPDASPPDAPVVPVQLISCTGVTPDANIGTTGSSYVPPATTINAGDIIKFTPTGAHDMVSGTGGTPDGEFQTPVSQIACLRFNQPGIYPFFCSIHGFTGTVTVN